MKTTFRVESHASPAPGILPEPPVVQDEPAVSPRRGDRSAGGASTTRRAARRTPLARLLAALRGDKYMVDAYPPAMPPGDEG